MPALHAKEVIECRRHKYPQDQEQLHKIPQSKQQRKIATIIRSMNVLLNQSKCVVTRNKALWCLPTSTSGTNCCSPHATAG